MKHALAAVLLITAALTQGAYAQTLPAASLHGYPVTEIFTTEDYGQHDQNWGLLVAENGIIQVANGHGLMEWDGEQWRTYETPGRTRLRAITRWIDGRIYTGTINEIGFYEVTPVGGLEFTSLVAHWPEEDRQFGEVWFVTSNSQWVVFSTQDQLFVYDGQEIRTVPDYAPGSYRIFNVDDRIVTRQRETNNLVQLVDDGGFRLEVLSSHLPEGAYPMAVYTDGAGFLVVTAVHGIFRLDADGFTPLHEPEAFGEDVVLYSSFIDADGYHYVGTLKHGLYIIDPEGRLTRNFRAEHGLGTSTVLAITSDGQGNLWLGGTPVVTRMVPPHRHSRHVTEDNSLSLSDVVEHQGRLYLGGLGFYVMAPDENPLLPPEFRLIEDMGNFQVWGALSVDEDLLLAMNGGITRVRMGADATFAEKEVIAEAEFAYEIDRVPGQDVFYAASDNGLHRIEQLPDGRWESIQIEGVARSMRRVEIEADDVVWVAAEDDRLLRVSAIDPETGEAIVETFESDAGLDESGVFPLTLEGELYFGSRQGLLHFDPAATPPFQLSERFRALFDEPEPELTFAKPDGHGGLWYQVDGRVARARPDGDGWAIDMQRFSGLPGPKLEDVRQFDADGVWLIYDEVGVHAVDLSALSERSVTPQLQIRSVRDLETDEAYFLGAGTPALPRLDQTNNSLRIRFALPDFRSDTPTRYRTRLVGSGADRWSEWSTESRKDYTLLGGGRYRFEVEARDGTGRVTAATALAFSVDPHWYASRPAVAAYILIGLLGLGLAAMSGSRWRKRQAAAKQHELEQLVRERTRALARANRQLEKIANSDGLTGLANRRLFDLRLSELAEASAACSLVLIDVDHFKTYNDTHGHLAGDDLLKRLAGILLEVELPEESLIARYGGEEFAIVLPEIDKEHAIDIARGVRRNVEGALNVTVSLGVAQRILSSADDCHALIAAADAGLYTAKSGGRNQVISEAS